MEVCNIVLSFIKLRDIQTLNKKVIKADLDIFLKQSKLRIVLSLLLKDSICKSDDNDEIVLELIMNKETLKGVVDITDSKGCYYLKNENMNINDEYMNYLRKVIDESVNNISKV